jgi:DNA-binding PadR family transcriptional regulator
MDTAPEEPVGVNEMEQLILLALARLDDGAYGVPIREQIEERARRSVSIAAVYAALDRLQRRGLVESWLSDPLPERGGRARKHFRLTAAGATALLEARASMDRMWEGLDLRPDLLEQ